MKIDNLQEVALGSEALSYVREVLGTGKGLAKCIMETLHLDSGRISTYLPAGTTTTATNQFRIGGKLPEDVVARIGTSSVGGDGRINAMPVPNLDALLVSRIATHLKSHHLAICMFENALAHANDPWLYQSKVHTLICGQDVYHFLTNEDDPNLIQLTVKKARSIEPPLVGVLSESSSPPSFPDGRIKLSDLRRIAERTEQLLVGAYDGEGFLVWHK